MLVGDGNIVTQSWTAPVNLSVADASPPSLALAYSMTGSLPVTGLLYRVVRASDSRFRPTRPETITRYGGSPQSGAALIWVDLDDTVRATLRTSGTAAFDPAQTLKA